MGATMLFAPAAHSITLPGETRLSSGDTAASRMVGARAAGADMLMAALVQSLAKAVSTIELGAGRHAPRNGKNTDERLHILNPPFCAASCPAFVTPLRASGPDRTPQSQHRKGASFVAARHGWRSALAGRWGGPSWAGAGAVGRKWCRAGQNSWAPAAFIHQLTS